MRELFSQFAWSTKTLKERQDSRLNVGNDVRDFSLTSKRVCDVPCPPEIRGSQISELSSGYPIAAIGRPAVAFIPFPYCLVVDRRMHDEFDILSADIQIV